MKQEQVEILITAYSEYFAKGKTALEFLDFMKNFIEDGRIKFPNKDIETNTKILIEHMSGFINWVLESMKKEKSRLSN